MIESSLVYILKEKTINAIVIIFLTVTIASIFPCKTYGQLSLNVASFGIDSADATPAVLATIEAAKAKKVSKIIIPKGIYHFYPAKAQEKYLAISNNDNGLKRIAFPLIGFENLEIDGQGSTFIMHGAIIPFLVEQSKNISLKNFNIDWDRPIHSEGTVIAVNEKNKTFDLQMSKEFPYEIRGHELIYMGINGYEQGLQENVFFDPNTRAIAYDNTKYLMDPWMKRLDYEYSAKEISPGVVRILDTIAEALPKVGWVFATKGNKMQNRISPAIHLLYSSNIDLSNINIYHAGSMGVIAEKSQDISLTKLNVTLAPGSKRMMSAAADATHFVGCKGRISLIDCLFENMHDDGTNVHGVYTLLDYVVNNNTVAVKLNHVQQFGFDFAAKGDSVRLVDRATMTPYAILVVKDVKKINEEYSYLIFAEDIKSVVKPNTAVENISWYPNHVIIKGCTIRNNRARGILISTSGNVEITNNYFANEMAAISIGGDANFWWESGPVNKVLISNNVFGNCCTSKLNQAVIMVDPNILKPKLSGGYFEKNITITNNTFKTFDNPILKARSTDGLKFSNNTIIQTKTFPPFYPHNAAIDITYSTNIVIQKNVYNGDKNAVIQIDANSESRLLVNKNKGFAKMKK